MRMQNSGNTTVNACNNEIISIGREEDSELLTGSENASLDKQLGELVGEFNELNRSRLEALLEQVHESFESSKLDDASGLKVVNKLCFLKSTPYFHFYAADICRILMHLLLKKVKQSQESKMKAFEFLLVAVSASELFMQLSGLYERLATFRVGGVLFRNYALQRLFELFFNECMKNIKITKNGKFQAPKGSFDGISCACNFLDSCQGFAEHVVRSLSNLPCRGLVLAYLHHWLGKIKVDLLKAKAVNVKGIESRMAGRIFTVYGELHKQIILAADDQVQSSFIGALYKNCSPKNVSISLYRRLFFFFLLSNRRLLTNCFILRVFSKDEIHRIYKELRDLTPVFSYVFRTLDRRYLIRELSRCPSRALFEAVPAALLSSADLPAYYSAYFRIVESQQACDLELQVSDIECYARIFNTFPDREFIRFIKPRLVYEPGTLTMESARMLADYSACTSSTLVDTVFLSSLLLDNPSLLHKKNISYHNFLLATLANASDSITGPLCGRLRPFLLSLLRYDDYLLRAALLYSKLFPPPTGVVTDLRVWAALNLPGFEDAFNQQCESPHRETALLFYLHHAPAFAESHMPMLKNILLKNDQNTLLLLELLSSADLASSLPFSFVCANIDVFFTLINTPSFSRLVISIFISQLRSGALLPCMVIPHVLSFCSPEYILRKFLDTAVNCIPNTLLVMLGRVREKLRTDDGELMLSKEAVREAIDNEMDVQFISDLVRAAGLKKVIGRVPFEDDLLCTFIILRQVRSLGWAEKKAFLEAAEKGTQTEAVRELVQKTREFYKRISKGLIPIDFMVEL